MCRRKQVGKRRSDLDRLGTARERARIATGLTWSITQQRRTEGRIGHARDLLPCAQKRDREEYRRDSSGKNIHELSKKGPRAQGKAWGVLPNCSSGSIEILTH